MSEVDPNLRLGTDPRGRVRYPSPFFDLSQQYIPPTIKELFKWVYFYVTNNSFLGPAMQKMARYPVTDLVFEDTDADLVRTWTTLMANVLQIKTFNMETNMDLLSYGNAFVTIHYPFTRLLECPSCKTRSPWKSVQKRVDNLVVKGKCPKCNYEGVLKITDVPFKSAENIRLVRINPEYIDIKFNETTGRHTYLYSIPDRLKKQIMAGDPDILEDTPQIYIEAIRQKRKIKLSHENVFHLKNPTLAGKDMGWGLPRVAAALKDLYHYYVLRRAQEAVMHEHIVPFDILFPQANGKMDPYVNTDLSVWKKQMERELANRRKDPNYKAILPFPVGFARIGGDGKALMLTPEMDFLAKAIVGACGIPLEFIFGGTMSWSGSSVSLRTLENDFLHQRSQLLQMNIWLVERLRIYMQMSAPKSCRYTDFKMADDVQRQQIMLSMASSGNLPWEDLHREFGRDPEVVRKKLQEEAEFTASVRKTTFLRDAEAQALAQLQAMKMQAKSESNETDAVDKVTAETVNALVQRMQQLPPDGQEVFMEKIKELDSRLYGIFEKALANAAVGRSPVPTKEEMQNEQVGEEQRQVEMNQQQQLENQRQQLMIQHQARTQAAKQPRNVINMKPSPQQKPPRRQGGI